MCVYKGLFIWRRVTRLTELLALSGNSPSIENYRFPGEMFTWRKRVTRLGEFPVERGGTLCLGNSANRSELLIDVQYRQSESDGEIHQTIFTDGSNGQTCLPSDKCLSVAARIT